MLNQTQNEGNYSMKQAIVQSLETSLYLNNGMSNMSQSKGRGTPFPPHLFLQSEWMFRPIESRSNKYLKSCRPFRACRRMIRTPGERPMSTRSKILKKKWLEHRWLKRPSSRYLSSVFTGNQIMKDQIAKLNEGIQTENMSREVTQFS